MAMRLRLAILALACWLVSPSVAFLDHGHLLVGKAVKLRAEAGKNEINIKDIEKFEELAQSLQALGHIPSPEPFTATFEWCGASVDYLSHTVPRFQNGDPNKPVVLRAMADPRFVPFHYLTVYRDINGKGPLPEFEKLQYEENIIKMADLLSQSLKMERKFVKYPSLHFTPFTLYDQFCLWMHLMADMALPVHVGGTKSKCYPNGDMGSNRIMLETHEDKMGSHFRSIIEQTRNKPTNYPMTNLHALWDSMAWYPGSIEEEKGKEAIDRSGFIESYVDGNTGLLRETYKYKLENDARRLLDEFAYHTVAAEHPPDAKYYKMAEASHNMYQKEVVKGIPLTVYNNCLYDDGIPSQLYGGEPFSPSNKYVENAHKVTKKAIAIAVYRVEYHLAQMMKKWREDKVIDSLLTTLPYEMPWTIHKPPLVGNGQDTPNETGQASRKRRSKHGKNKHQKKKLGKHHGRK